MDMVLCVNVYFIIRYMENGENLPDGFQVEYNT
jgi:hypothetical protein